MNSPSGVPGARADDSVSEGTSFTAVKSMFMEREGDVYIIRGLDLTRA